MILIDIYDVMQNSYFFSPNGDIISCIQHAKITFLKSFLIWLLFIHLAAEI